MVSQLNDEQVKKLQAFLDLPNEEVTNETLKFLREELKKVIAQTPESRKRIQELNTKVQHAQSNLVRSLNLESYLIKCIVEKLEVKISHKEERK